MLASAKKESFDEPPIRTHFSKGRESNALVAPWEQEEDPENYISSQFINFLDSKMKNPDLLKKASTMLEPSTIPDIESYTQNLTRSIVTDQSPMQKEQNLLSRQRIAEKALDKSKDSSVSVTMSFSKKKSDMEEISLESSGIMQKQPSLKKESSLLMSPDSLALTSQVNNRPKREYYTKKSLDFKPKSSHLKRPSTGISYNRESSIKSPGQYRGSLMKDGTFFEFAEEEKDMRESGVLDHGSLKERIKSARKEKYRSSKTISDPKALLNHDNDTQDIKQVITRKSDGGSHLFKSSEQLDSQIVNERMHDTLGLLEHEKHSLAYLLSGSSPDNDKPTENRPASSKVTRTIKTSGMRARKSGVISTINMNSGLNVSYKSRDNNSMSIQSLHPPSLLLSSNVLEDRLTPVKKGFSISGNPFTPQRNHINGSSEERGLPVGVQPFVENRSSIFIRQYENNDNEEKEEEKVDIQDSIRFTNKVWSTHKDQYGNIVSTINTVNTSVPLKFQKYEGEKPSHKREPSSERIVNLNAQAEKFQKTVVVTPNRPETAASKNKRVSVSPQKFEGITSFEKAKRYFMNKTFRVKENSVLQKSLERIRQKAILDVSKTMKLHNMANLNKTEDEHDAENKKVVGQEKLKNLLSSSTSNAIFIAGTNSGSVSANYQGAKDITFQNQMRQIKRPKLKRNIE